ncbi:MAG: response regulator transcription factor [Erysipelotrichales bacterium]|nr:response regulator transcription factor [Erysipelotrichales bacterium]MBQ1386528.1 response regulator transcription factor [Erysipelotrichales bacterium]MBQ2310566.1 response regulator transcription factor [Erysipelotrichales bacterium]MBQ2479555.1 response regulator transcription factor [Erysipelotrichales bacterium]MBQ4011401.1 response regulator transcription factor [Erysipelotrichales bacterium]
MSEMKLLVVEDDRSVLNLIATTLKIHGYSFVTAMTGKEAVSLCASHHPDLILLDLGLPDMDGIDVIRTVRTWSGAMIIIISARGEDSDKILALDSGADDYITKPFSIDELLARIRAASRRMKFVETLNDENSVFINGDLKIDYASNLVYVKDKEIHLTPIEYKLLCLLARNAGKVLTHSYIIDKIWGSGVDTDIVSLRVYMTSLRKKIRGEEDFIRTHIGIGYQMIRK